MRIDAHHHLWRYNPEEYGWIDDSMRTLRRDFLPPDLNAELLAAGLEGTVVVQARQTLEETHWLLQLASLSPRILGVVGWAPLADPAFPQLLAELRAFSLLKGLRHVVQAEPSGFLDDPAFNRGIALLPPTDLVYDILIFARQLPEATRFVDRHPHQSFVLDHLAKPDIRNHGFAAWDRDLRELARRPNVTCKLSGLVTEADWQHWTPAGLKPFFDTVLEAFTPARIMAGSDWPVLTVAATYQGWWKLLSEWLDPLSPTERADIEGATAARIYHLEP